MQEVMSVVFSLANLLAHLHCLARLLRHIRVAQRSAVSSQHNDDGGNDDYGAVLGARTEEVEAGVMGVSVGPGATALVKRAAAAAAAGSNLPAPRKSPPPPRNHSARAYPYTALWVAYGIAHANAWVWSAVFHSRDTKFTEKFDYCSAIAVISVGLAVSLARALGLRRRLKLAWIVVPVAGLTAAHLWYMFNVKFDYAWNVKVRRVWLETCVV